MLRRKPSKIEVKLEDKQELEDSRKPSPPPPSTANATSSSSLLHLLDRSHPNPSSKLQRIGLSP